MALRCCGGQLTDAECRWPCGTNRTLLHQSQQTQVWTHDADVLNLEAPAATARCHAHRFLMNTTDVLIGSCECVGERMTCTHRQQLARRGSRTGNQLRNLQRITKAQVRLLGGRMWSMTETPSELNTATASTHVKRPFCRHSPGWKQLAGLWSCLRPHNLRIQHRRDATCRKSIHAEKAARMCVFKLYQRPQMLPWRSPCDRPRSAATGTNASNVTQRSCSGSSSTPNSSRAASPRFPVTHTWSSAFTSSSSHPFSLFPSSDADASLLLHYIIEWSFC